MEEVGEGQAEEAWQGWHARPLYQYALHHEYGGGRDALMKSILEDSLKGICRHAELRSFEDPDAQQRGPGGRAAVHEAILREKSKVLAAMMDSCMSESSSRIVVLHASMSSINALVTFMHLGHFQDLSFNAGEVWVLAHQLDVKGVKKFLMRTCIDRQNVASAMHFALNIQHNLDKKQELAGKCKDFLRYSSNPADICTASKSLDGVCVDAMKKICTSFRLARPEHAQELFRLVVRWVNANGNDIQGARRIIGSALLRKLPKDFLLGEVRSSGILLQEITLRCNMFSNVVVTLPGINPFEETTQSLASKIRDRAAYDFRPNQFLVDDISLCTVDNMLLVEHGIANDSILDPF